MHLPQLSPSSRTSPLPLPPPLPPKHKRRLSIKSITSSLRKSASFSSPIDDDSPFSHWSPSSESEENRNPRTRRSSSIFSWKSTRSSVVAITPTDNSDEVEEKLKSYKFPQKSPSVRSSKHRRSRASSPPPPVPPLVIEIDSLPTYTNENYKPLPRHSPSQKSASSDRPSSPPSLPDFRQSTFQPLSFDTKSSTLPPPPVPKLPTKFTKQLAARGPFPNRPLSTLSTNSPDSLSGPRQSSTRSSTPLPPSTPEASIRRFSSVPRLEPRSPRVHRRTRSTPSLPPPSQQSISSPALPLNAPPPAPSTGSSSMIRSPSFTLSLPTVAEVPPPSPTPAPKRKLKPISIAPRTPSVPSTPDLSQSSTANSSPCFSTLDFKEAVVGKERRTSAVVVDEKKEKIDWEDLEKRLRGLSEDRLQILLRELERAK